MYDHFPCTRFVRQHLSVAILALALTHVQALAAAPVTPIEPPQKITTLYNQFITTPTSRSQISKHYIKQTGALNLTLAFDSIKLPTGAYVELLDEAGLSQFFTSAEELANGVVISGDSVTIRVVSDGLRPASLRLKTVTYQPAPSPIQSRKVIGEDNRRDLECYAGTPIYAHALATVVALGSGSGSLIGNGRYLLTNAHVTPELPAGGQPTPLKREITLGWFDATCGASSAISRERAISLRTSRQLVRGTAKSANDYALVELDSFDVEHSHALEVFGSLKISGQKAIKPEQAIYVPQYGNGGLQPMVVADKADDGGNARVLRIDSKSAQQAHNADTDHGSSGSPTIDQATHEIIGLHWGSSWDGKTVSNLSVGLPVLQQAIIPLIGPGNNQSVVGEGKYRGEHLQQAPYIQTFSELNIPSGGYIATYPDMPAKHLGQYSTVTIDLQNVASKEITSQVFQVAIKDDNGTHDLSTAAGKNAVLILNTQAFQQAYSPQTLTGWLPVRINDEQGQRLQNLILSLRLNSYNPFQSPFDGVNTQQVYLNIPDARRAVTIQQLMKGQQYSYLATYPQQGPHEVESLPKPKYADIWVPLRETSGNVTVVKLRGSRGTSCVRRPMNAGVHCQSTLMQSSLILEYVPEDNPNLAPGTYSGLLPVNAVAQGESREMLVNIKLTQL